MKQKTGRKLLGFLLTLAMVIGLLSGMSLTAYAAQETKTVTWNYATWDAIQSGNTTNGIKFTGDKISGNLYDGSTTVFKAPAGYEFTRIEFPTTGTDIGNGEAANGGTFSVVDYTFDSTQDGETVDGQKVTWTGESDTVSFKKNTYAIEYITFTMVGEVVGVESITINNSELTLTVGGTQTLTATVSPNNATDKTVKWSVGGTNAGAVKLYTDENCTTEVGTDATSTLTVYAKGISAGSATVTATSNADSEKKASCDVTVIPPHTHDFTYSASGATITATCSAAGCDLTDSKATLTIVAPTMTVYQETGKSEVASLTGLQDFNTATGKSLAVTNIMYVGRDGTEYTESTTAPTNAGKYTATITLSGVKTAEGDDKSVAASVDYSIKYAVTFNTNGGSEVPQQLVEAGESATKPTDPTKEGNIFGGWFADADFAESYVFDEVTENTTVYAKWGEHRVTWTVGRFSIQDVFTGNAPAADSNTTVNLAAETLKPEGATFEGWKTETDESGDVTYTAQFSFPVTLNVNGGTINAGNVESYIYGTGATLPTDVTRAKYDFDGWYANSGLTGTAVTQIGTTEVGSKEFWAKWTEVYAVPATVTANSRTYDGTEKPLVTVTGTATGGEMQYALGDANGATQPYTTSIPAKTEAGTYYVWYKVDGDDNHNDTGTEFVQVTIAQASIANAVVTLNNTSLDYTGSEQSVSVTGVKLGEKMLTAGTDYEVSGETTGTNKGTYTVTVTGKGNYKDTAKAQWTISPVIPTITTVPTASAITYGQTLKDSTLSGGLAKNGNAEVAGTFTWKDSTIAPAVSDSETTEYDVVFTPTDTENYRTAECKVKLTVNPASEPEDTSDGDATYTQGDTESGIQGLDTGSVKEQMEGLAEADETPCGDNQTKEVTVTMDVSSTSETSVGSDEKSAILSIVGDQDGVQVDYLEITVKKSVTLYNVDGNGNKTNPQSETTTMHELGRVVDIPVKYDMTGKQNPVVARYHDGHTAKFTRLDAAPAAADMRDGTFYIEGSGKDAIIHIYSSMFSTYAILTNAETPASPAVITVAPAAKDLTWTGAAQELVTAGTAEGGTMQYALGADATTAPADGWSGAIPAGTNVGTYYVWYKAVGDATHTESAAGCVAVEIKKASAVITTAPAAVPGLIWTGAPQALVTAGTAEGGTVIYALGADATTAPADGWSETIPAATEAGTYYVWYKAVGDANHSDSARDCVVAAIAQKEREKPSGDLNALLKTKGLKGLILTWTPMANVDGYDVFMAKCTSEFSSEPYATLAAEASQLEFGKLKKKTSYKVNIRAFVLKDGVKEYVGQNEILHSITGGADKKSTNAVKISAKNMSLAVGDKKQAKVTVKGQKKGLPILSHGGAVRYLSSDPSIATVSDKGFVRGVGEGSCTIFLSTHNGLRTTITVTVTGGPEELKFDQKSYKLSIGKTLKLKKELKLLPEGTKAELKWKSSDKKIATVDENGKVTAKKAGTVKITVTTSNGITATVKIKIK